MEKQELKREKRYCWRKNNLDDLSELLKSNSLSVETVVKNRRVSILPLSRKKQSYFLHVDTRNIIATFSDYSAILMIGNTLGTEDHKLYEIAKKEYPHGIGIDFPVLRLFV